MAGCTDRGEEGDIFYGPESALAQRYSESEMAAALEAYYLNKFFGIPQEGDVLDNYDREFNW